MTTCTRETGINQNKGEAYTNTSQGQTWGRSVGKHYNSTKRFMKSIPVPQWGWITLYVVTIVIAVLGNLLFLVSCACTRRTRTTGYYLLINLSIRDILLGESFLNVSMPYESKVSIFDSHFTIILTVTMQITVLYCIKS
jgi:hypothetical protein